MIASLFWFYAICHFVLAGKNSSLFHREILLSLKPFTLLKKDLRLMIFSGEWIKVWGIRIGFIDFYLVFLQILAS